MQRASGRGGPVLGVIALAVGEVGVGRHERQRGVAGHLLVGEVAEPAAEGRVVALGDVAEGIRPQQISRELRVARRCGMADRGVDVIVRGVPAAGAPVQVAFELRLVAAQLGPEHLRQQAVVAVPLVRAVQANDEGVGPCEVPQRPGRSGLREDGIAQRSGEPIEHGRAPQEGHLLGREVREQRVGHVVRHDPIVAAEPCDRRRCVRLIAQRQGGEIEPGGPALRPPHERVDVRVAKGDSRELEQRGRLAAGHDEVARRQLEHLAMGSQAPERQRRLAPRGEHDLRARGRVLDEAREDVDRGL